MNARPIIALLLAAVVSSPANAQMFDGFLSAPGIGMLDIIRRNETFWEPLASRDQNGTGNTSQPLTSATVDSARLTFTPILANRQQNLAGFVAKTRAQSPENAARMEQLFASTDVFATLAQELAPKGLRIDNLADAFTVYWITAWEVSHGISGSDTSRAQAQAVKAQVSRTLLTMPEVISASAAQKQELAEVLLIQTALISASAESASNDDEFDAVGKAVRRGAQAIGLDLDAMVLSEAGFVPAGS